MPLMSRIRCLNRHHSDGLTAFTISVSGATHEPEHSLHHPQGTARQARRGTARLGTHLLPSIEPRQSFMQGPAYDAYIAAVSPLLAHPPEIHAATVAWAKGMTAPETETA
ncbi:hypothetical protein QLQ85_17460 [Halomonas sp. M4R5S39]|uniref:hypothetical protein n=1 Tax=Halomonas kalidii TaxID=3043293 RepID=UPI0024A9C8AA|nr:hypothetical protein [Halomonas kalidii]MDI5986585.1 hypothetical protein [Halomonas kalidii]